MAAAPEGPARAPQPAQSPAAALLGQPSATRNAGSSQAGMQDSSGGTGGAPGFSELLHQGPPAGDTARAGGTRAPTKRPSESQTTPASSAASVLNATLTQMLGSCAPASGASVGSSPAAADDAAVAAVANATDASSAAQASTAAQASGGVSATSATDAPGAAVMRALGLSGGTVPGAAGGAKTTTDAPVDTPAGAADTVSTLALAAPLTERAAPTGSPAVSADHGSSTDLSAPAGASSGSASAMPPDAASAGALFAHTFGTRAADDASPASAPLSAPVGSTAWVDELGSRLVLMAHSDIGSASLRLNPTELGPIEVRIDMRGSDSSVWFGAAHADTRAALEQSLPRLRELFAGQGLSLSDSGVFREPPRQQPSAAAPRLATNATVTPSSVTPVTPARVGLLDLYA